MSPSIDYKSGPEGPQHKIILNKIFDADTSVKEEGAGVGGRREEGGGSPSSIPLECLNMSLKEGHRNLQLNIKLPPSLPFLQELIYPSFLHVVMSYSFKLCKWPDNSANLH